MNPFGGREGLITPVAIYHDYSWLFSWRNRFLRRGEAIFQRSQYA
jgi:hypothetical protein